MSKKSGMHTQFSRAHSPIVTKTERDALIAARPKPIVQHNLRPNGMVQASVHQRVDALRKKRIREIANKLGKSSERLNQNRAKTFISGKAKADFGRSR
ncbi:MAG: hypothetical protein JKY99_12685 [Rhizobiales bacterium]|nr:hypothetical protein [Hyphomicrobiales bacterium]